MSNEKSMTETLLKQFDKGYTSGKKGAGWHESPSDSNTHLSVMNAKTTVIGHFYKDGIIKGTNEGGSGALPWLLKQF